MNKFKFFYKKKYNILKVFFILPFLFSGNKVDKLIVPFHNSPLVSIIIPIILRTNKKFKFTYQLLFSILNINTTIPYEIIITGDISDDETKELENYIKNIIILHNNDEKYNFIRNCNKASKNAKGKYILFLNIYSKVNKEWLNSLVNLIERDDKIGMVGSKFIYPNGKLQEAGGIVFNSGECLNFGKNGNPDMPEYNYVKEVDYISGASILIRKSIWAKISGFDERFSPEYYGDIDLAFQFRKNGYKIIYQPKSVVIHSEVISNKKTLKSEIKKYQEINKNKFIEKWNNELKYQESINNTFIARDRSYNKSRILIIDYSVPIYDKYSGGRFSYLYINLFKEIGFQVTFIGHDFQKPEPYTSILQQKGIEILYGNSVQNNIKNWLKKNLKYFKYIYFQRPNIAINYIDFVIKYFKGKIIYFPHDLHQVRTYREYLITNNTDKLEESKKFKIIENNIFSKVDIIHVVGNYEYNFLKKKYPNKIIRKVPLFFYDNLPPNIEKDFSKRKNIVFVGGFLHSPNVDAVLWFANYIFPKVLDKYPDIIWFIVGNNPTMEIKNLSSNNIKILNGLSDNNLKNLYQKSRISIAPLRFGAGIKGKIIEAIYNQIPVVTTSIGGEGLDNSTKAFIIEDDAKRMSEIIIDLYSNFTKLKEMSDSSRIFIQQYYLKKNAKEIIMKDIK